MRQSIHPFSALQLRNDPLKVEILQDQLFLSVKFKALNLKPKAPIPSSNQVRRQQSPSTFQILLPNQLLNLQQ